MVTICTDSLNRIIRIELCGPLRDDDLIDAAKRARMLPEFSIGFSLLYDARATTEMQLTRLGVYELVRISENDTNTLAIVAPEPAMFGMARMYELASDWKDRRVGVFANMAEANEWLQVERDTRQMVERTTLP